MTGVQARGVRVAASTSNLGPGFDFLGLALDVWLEVQARTADQHALATLEGTCTGWPEPAENIFFQAFDRARSTLGLPPLALEVDARSEIPLGRGLGSSGAAIAAGLAMGAGWEDPSRITSEVGVLVELGADLEGHPDNSTASLVGGCTLAIPSSSGLIVLPVDLHPDIGFAVAWPEAQVATSEARAVLPGQVPFEDAVENPRRFAALAEGLRSARPDLVAAGLEDTLHVRHRLPLIPGGEAALHAAREAGAWGATISGSGSTLIALCAPSDADRIATILREAFEGQGGRAWGRAVRPVHHGPLLEER